MALVALILACCLCGCESPTAAVDRPYLVMEQPQIELGDLIRGRTKTVTMSFHNRGGGKLEIDTIETSCKCTAASIDRAELLPGESGLLSITIEVERTGASQASVLVHSNSESRSVTPVAIQWCGVAHIELDPPAIDLGAVRPGSVHQSAIRVVTRRHLLRSEVPFRFVNASSPSGDVTCQLTGDSLPAESVGVLTIDAGSNVGAQRSVLELDFDGGWTGTLRLPVHWTVTPAVVAIPPRLSLGRGEPRDPFRGAVEIRSIDGPLNLLPVKPPSNAEWLSDVTIERLSDDAVRLQVQGVLPAQPGIMQAKLTAAYSRPEIGEVNIPISVFIDEAE